MKHKNLLKLLAVVMILAMAMTMLVACGPKDEPKPEDDKPTFTAKQAADEIAEAIVNSLGQNVDVTKAVGFEYSLNIPTDKGDAMINLKGVLDTKTAANTKVYLDFVENYDSENRVFSLSADDEYLYFDSLNAKRKFTGFNLSKNLVGASLPGYDSISGGMIGSLPGIVFDLIMDLGEDAEFEHEVDPDEGTTVNTIHGSFAGLAPLIGGVVDGIIPGAGAKLGEFLGKVNIELTTIITADKKIDYADLIFSVDGKELDLGFTSKLANDFTPDFKVPEKYDTRYVETKLLNFLMDGEFNMGNAKYTYDIKFNVDPFEMLDKAIVVKKDGSIAFDASRILDITDGGFYVNVKHECGVDCKCGKMVEADGSVFSIAYAPKDFGNQNIYMTVNLRALLPEKILDKALGGVDKVAELEAALVKSGILKEGQTIMSLVPEGQQTITMDTKALLASAVSPIAEADLKGNEAAATALENYNPLKTVVDVYNFLAGITYDYNNGVRVEVKPIINAIANANTIINEKLAESNNFVIKTVMGVLNKKGMSLDLAAALKTVLFDDFEIKVINAKYGDPVLDTMNFQDMFDHDATPSKPVNRVTAVEAATDGKLEMTTESGVDMTGNLSDKEWAAILNAPKTVKVNYTLSDGSKVNAVDAKVVTIAGLDLNKKDVDQVVYIIVAPVDGLLKGNAHVAAHQFQATVKVSSLAKENGVAFTNKVAAEPYAFGAAIDANVDMKLTYADNTTKTYTGIAPIANAQLVKGGKINALEDIKLGYDKFGYTTNVDVKVASKQAANIVDVDIKLGADNKPFILTDNFTFKIGEAADEHILKNGLKADMINEKTVSFSWTTEPARYILNANYNKLGGYTGHSIVFDEVGDYELTMNVVGGYSKTFKFHVTVAGAPAPATK